MFFPYQHRTPFQCGPQRYETKPFIHPVMLGCQGRCYPILHHHSGIIDQIVCANNFQSFKLWPKPTTKRVLNLAPLCDQQRRVCQILWGGIFPLSQGRIRLRQNTPSFLNRHPDKFVF